MESVMFVNGGGWRIFLPPLSPKSELEPHHTMSHIAYNRLVVLTRHLCGTPPSSLFLQVTHDSLTNTNANTNTNTTTQLQLSEIPKISDEFDYTIFLSQERTQSSFSSEELSHLLFGREWCTHWRQASTYLQNHEPILIKSSVSLPRPQSRALYTKNLNSLHWDTLFVLSNYSLYLHHRAMSKLRRWISLVQAKVLSPDIETAAYSLLVGFDDRSLNHFLTPDCRLYLFEN
jgi:hypothetical protein